MLRYCFTAVLLSATFLGFSQGSIEWIYPQLDPALFNAFIVSTPETFGPFGPTQQLNYETGEPELVNPAIRHYDNESSTGPNVKNITGWSRPALRICLGGNEQAPASLVTTANETREIEEIYVGRHKNGTVYNTLTISNTDTLRIQKLYIPFGCTLIHEGPAPLVIQGEMHNNGYVKTNADAIVFEVDYENHLVSTCENTGTIVGRIQYQVLLNRATDSWNGMVLAPYWSNLLGNGDITIPEIEYEAYLEAALDNTVPYLPSGIAEQLLNYIADQDYLTAAQLVLDILPTISVPAERPGLGYNLRGYPLKGVRHNKWSGDLRNKATWQPYDRRLTGWSRVNSAGETYTSAPSTPQHDCLVIAGGNVEGAVTNVSQDMIAALGLELGVYVNISNQAVADWITENVDVSGSGFNTDAADYTITQDSAYLVGPDVWAVYNATSINNETGEISYFIADIPVSDLEFVVPITLFAGNGFFNSDLPGDASDPSTYGRWYYADTVIQNVDLNGWRDLNFWTGTSTILTYENLATSGSNANQRWEDPLHLSVRDSTGGPFNEAFNYVTNTSTPLAALGATTDPIQQPYAQYYPYHYPYDENRSNQFGRALGREARLDHDTPAPFPQGWWSLTYRDDMTERVYEYSGFPWLNSAQSYAEQPTHPPYPGQPAIPNLMPGQSDELEVKFAAPPRQNFVWVYAPDGNLFEGPSFAACLDQSSEIYESLGYESAEELCYQAAENTLTVPQIIGYSNDGTLFSPEYEEVYDDLINTGLQIEWELISNPLMGYLDLNKTAADYFEDYPGADFLEFVWFNALGDEYDLGPNFAGEETPDWFGDYPDYQPSQRTFWRRKYFRFGDEIISSELDYVLNLLYDVYNSGGAATLSNLALDIAEDFQDGVIDATDGPVFNYLNSGDINPNKYFPLGRYVAPGNGLWMRNFSSDMKFVAVKPDHGIYNHEFPLENLGEIFVGDAGPFGNILNGGNINDNTGGRLSTSKTAANSLMDELSSSTAVVAYGYENDSTMMPFIFLEHSFQEDAINGAHQSEEAYSSLPSVPFVYTDSSHFRPTNVFVEESPHNHQPLHCMFPPPPIDGAWIIEPLKLQTTGSPYYDELGTLPFPRVAIELYDSTGFLTDIEYLNVGDTLWLRDADYDFPIEGRLYFTNLIGDLNGDGIVSSQDLLDFFLVMGCCEDDGCVTGIDADFDNDGCVDVADYLMLLQSYGNTIGNEDGQWSAPGPSMDPDNPGLIIDQTEINAVTTFYQSLPDYSKGGIVFDGNNNLIAQGQEMTLFAPNLAVIAKGRNRITLPRVAGDYVEFALLTDKGLFALNVDDVDHMMPLSETKTGGTSGILNGVPVTLNTGSEIQFIIDDEIDDPTDTQGWIDFYTNMGVEYYTSEIEGISPMLGQVYYGAFSAVTDQAFVDITDPGLVNDAIPFIDAFGAGIASYGLETFTHGVYNDPMWDLATTRYLTGVGNNSSVFPRKNISLAYITRRVETTPYSARGSATTQASVRKAFIGGTTDYFDKYSIANSVNDVAFNTWGNQIGNFDSQLHQGVLAGVSQMTMREYFRFKLQGVSPKFGVQAHVDDRTSHYPNSFGSQYNLRANIFDFLQPGVSWSPCEIGTYDDWFDEIITPFFEDFDGDIADLTTGGYVEELYESSERNNNAGHYSWIYNSPLYTNNTSLGPLIYDMNLDGQWTLDDKTILRGIFDYWSALGDDAHRKSVARAASYYRAGGDAIHTASNAIPYLDSLKGKYEPSRLFNEYFDLDAEGGLFFNTAIFTWANCLDHVSFEGPRTRGTTKLAAQFGTESMTYDNLFWAESAPGGGFKLTESATSKTTAPATSTGYYEAFGGTRYAFAPQAHPAPDFFPASFVSAPPGAVRN